MTGDPNRHETGLQDEEAFEASLLGDADPSLEDTQILPAPGQAAPKAPSSKPQLQPRWVGRRLGRYKLLRLLGEGTMGVVIQAMDVNLQRVVALKVLRQRVPGLEQHQKVRQFLQEARAIAQLEHPSIVRIYEIDQHDGWWYIAMEMVEGDTLKRIIKAAGPLPIQRACSVIADAATALAAMHELGIIHRDVKPSNIMVTRAGRGKLTDFGFVRRGDDPFGLGAKTVGTPKYMAPESLRPDAQTPAMDVYSLATTLYCALTGKAPFRGSSISDVIRQHIQSPPPDLAEALPNCPPSLAQLVKRAMAKNPAERPTAAEFAAALRAEAITSQPEDSVSGAAVGSSILPSATASRAMSVSVAPPERRPIRRSRWRRWLAWLLPALAVLAGAAGIIVWLTTGRADLSERFPSAPVTYGTRPAGEQPVDTGPTEPPPFSWVGKVDLGDARFVASRRGRFFYPIDSRQAALIRAEDVIGYKTQGDALADGKVPVP